MKNTPPDSPTESPWTHRLVVATTIVALLPIAVGALTTTLQAGMAFLDWPTSDGHNMLLYDWFADLRAGRVDKAVEHGHRLAGMVIGLFGIALVVVAWRTNTRAEVRWLATAILCGIVAQGLLGGLRVVEDERLLAMLHGQFAAVVFSLLAVTWIVSERRWAKSGDGPEQANVGRLLPLAAVTPVVLVLQYFLGGLLRHFGTALFEHIGLALIAYGMVVAASVTALVSGSGWLRRSGLWMLLAVHAQVGLGVAAFVLRFGFAPTGYVAVVRSSSQIVVASAHTVIGMVLLSTTVVYLVKVARLAYATRESHARVPAPGLPSLVEGGTA